MIMKAHAASGQPGVKKYLNVCYLQSVVVTHVEEPNLHYMTLLAHATVHKQKAMVNFLLKSGASKS